ncbi:Plasmodium exported protein, unknown function [Plasmodium vivax]|uniref:Uncharacterized protein n=1 Tax=Plasmodium vivax TaxID=5855 RepID=A0A565A2M0_PLAVI|nr:Plasmodium exported protein, unknown function [Plasmodium vivax]
MFLFFNKFFVFISLTSISLYYRDTTNFHKLAYKNIGINSTYVNVTSVLTFVKLENKAKLSRVHRILSSVYENLKKQREKKYHSIPSNKRNKKKVKQNKIGHGNLKKNKINVEPHDLTKEGKIPSYKRKRFPFQKKDKFGTLKYLIEMSERNIHVKDKKKSKIAINFKKLREKISPPHLLLSIIGLLAASVRLYLLICNTC